MLDGVSFPQYRPLDPLFTSLHPPPCLLQFLDECTEHSMKRSRNKMGNGVAEIGVRLPSSLSDWRAKLLPYAAPIVEASVPYPFKGSVHIVFLRDFFLSYEDYIQTKKLGPGSPGCCPKDFYRFSAGVVSRILQVVGSVQSLDPRSSLVMALHTTPSTLKNPTSVVVGISVVSETNEVFRSSYEVEYGKGEKGQSHDGCTVRSKGIFCGVQFMWVAEEFRKRGICKGMIDLSLQHVCYGYALDRGMVAFFEPTEMGAIFAERYTGNKQFWAY